MQRFCIIDCENAKAWYPITFGDMFKEKLMMAEDSWITCNIAKNENLPVDILEFQGVVITGSHFNCRDNLLWYEPLCRFIQEAATKGYPKIFATLD